MKIGVLDTETTGVDPKECHVVELGLLKIDTKAWTDGHHLQGEQHQIRLKPPIDIPPEAMAVHDITNEDIACCPSASQAYDEVASWFQDIDIIVAHNLKYDAQIVAREFPDILNRYRDDPHGSLCTLRLSERFYPDLPSHQLQVLKYRFGLWGSDKAQGCELLAPGGAHSALNDCHVTASLLQYIAFNKLDGDDAGDKIWNGAELSRKVMLLKYIKFGKHKGELFADVARQDPGYIQWMSREEHLKEDPDMHHTVKFYMSEIYKAKHRR